MDPSLLQQAAEFHGPSFLWNVDNEQQMEVQSPFYSPFQSQANESLAQDHEFTEKLQKFLGQKADLLYRDPEPEAPNRASSLDDDDFYAIMPPLEAFMGIPPESAKGHLYNSLEKRDIVVGMVSSILDSGLIISLLCLDNGKARDLDQLKITAFCPVKELPKDFGNDSPVDAFQVKDKVRAVVVSVNQETQRIIVSLVSKSLPADAVYPKLGIISEDDYPVYYRRHLQIRGVTYDELLHSVMGFNNSHCVPYLMTRLGVESDSRRPPSLMRSLNSIQIPTSEYAEALRKVQSSKYAMRSVAEGISHFKAGKTLEAMQMLNKALQIDEGNVEALVARGALYANNESYTKAIEDFQGALRGNPDHSNARKYLRETLVAKGRELHDTGHYREAEEYYDKALQLERRDPEVIHYLRLCQRHEPVQVSRGSSSRRDSDREDAQSRMSGHSRHSGHSRRSDPMRHGSPPQQDSHGDFPLNQTKQKLKLLIEADRRGLGAQKHDDWSESSDRKRRVSETKYERMTSVSPSERGSRRDSIGGKERSDWSKEKSQKQQRRPQSPDTPDSRNLYGDASSSSSSSSSSGSSSDSSSSSSPSLRKSRSHRKSRSPRERHFSPSSSEKRQRYTSGDKENGKRIYGREPSIEKGREKRKYSSEYQERKHSRHSSEERPEERRYSSEANERRRYSVEGSERKRYSVEDRERRRYSVEDSERKRYSVEDSERKRYSIEDSERKRYSIEDSERKRYSIEDSERKRYSIEDSERKRYSVEDSERKRYSIEDSERKRYSVEDSERKRYSVEDSERRKYLSENERKKGTDYSQVHNRPGNIVRTITSGKGYSEKDGRYSAEVTPDLSSHRQDGHGHRTEDAGLEEARSVVMSSRRSQNSEESRSSPDAAPDAQSRNQEKAGNLSPRQLPSSRQVLPRKRSRFHDADEKPFVSYEENDDRNSKFMEYLEKKHQPSELKGSPEISEKVVHKRISPSPQRKPSPSVRSTPGKESSKALTPDPMIFQKIDSPVCRRTGALVVRENREDMPTHFRSAAAKPEASKTYREEDGKSSSLGMSDGLQVEGEKTMQSKSRRYDEIKIQVCTEKLSGGQQVRTVSGGLVLESDRQTPAQGSSLKDRTPGNQSPGHKSEHSDNYSRAGSSRTPMRHSRDRLSDKSEKMSNLPDVVKSAGRPTQRSLEHRDNKRESRTKRNYSRSRSPHDGKRRRESDPHPYRPRQSRFDSRERKRKRDLHRRSSSSASSSSDFSSSSSSRSGSPRKSKRRRTENEGEKPEEKQSKPSSGSKGQPPAQAKPLGPKMYLPRQVQLKSSIPHPPKSAVKTPAKPETAKPNLESKKGDKSQKELKEMESFLSQLKEKKKQQMIAEGVFDKYKKPV